MHEGSPYGHLKVGEKVILADNLARMVGEPIEVVDAWLKELHEAAVFDMANGVICSRRMIRDEELRKKRAAGGKLGGNPALKVNLEVNHKVKNEDKQNPTPSSSSSSSSSNTKSKSMQRGTRLPQDFGFPVSWIEFCSQQRPDLVPQEVFEGFKDYWIAQPGQKGVKTDWDATWRNWVRRQNKAQKTASEERRSVMAALTRGLATPKAPKPFWQAPGALENKDVEG